MMYPAGGGYEMTEEYNYNPYVLTLPEGNYTGPQMAAAIQDLLNGLAITLDFEVVYQLARGNTTIESKSEGMDEHNEFYIPSGFGIVTWMSGTDNDYPWTDWQGFVTTVDSNNLRSIHGVLRNSNAINVKIRVSWIM